WRHLAGHLAGLGWYALARSHASLRSAPSLGLGRYHPVGFHPGVAVDRRRPVRVAAQAPCRTQGFQPLAAGAWRRAGSYRCRAAGRAAGHASRVVALHPMRHITLLGATGSIGLSTLDVVARHPDRFRVHALSAQRRMAELAELAAR